MAKTLAEKLRIRENDRLLTIHAPADFQQQLGRLPTGVMVSTSEKKPDQVHWFVETRLMMEKQVAGVIKKLAPGVTIWVYYPKKSSGRKTDLTRDTGWDKLLAEGDRLVWISLISFDDTWSVFGIREKTAGDRKKEMKQPETREVFKWVDPVSKKITLPDEMARVLKKHKKEMAQFESLSFTNRKEYVEWIVTAKREETRQARLSGMIERLGKGWKNPSNR